MPCTNTCVVTDTQEEDKDGSAKEMLAKYSKWMKELMANTRDTPMYMSDIRTATTDNSNGNNTQPNASSSSALTTPPTSSEKPRTKLLPPSNAADDDDDDDIIVGDTLVSLVCPLSIDRVQKPAKGKNCAHMRCFELSMFLMYSEQAYNWQCPICEKALPFNELMIDDRMAAVLTEVDDEITDLRVSPDGSWIPINNHLRAGYTSSKRDRDDDDDEDGAASPSLKKTKLNNPPEVFCLLDDDEDAPSSSSSSSSSPSSSSSSSSYPSSSSSPYGTPALPNPLTSGLNGSYTVYESAAYRQTSSHAQPSSSASGTGQSFDDAICID